MKNENRQILEDCIELQNLLISREWTTDIHGYLQSKYYQICNNLSLDDGDAEEYLGEEN